MFVICSTSLSLIVNSAFALNPAKFNTARTVLVNAGFDSAEKTHPSHNKPQIPDSHGTKLIKEAEDELTQKHQELSRLQQNLGIANNNLTKAQKAANDSRLTPKQRQPKRDAVNKAQTDVNDLTAKINRLNRFINNAPAAISNAKNKLT